MVHIDYIFLSKARVGGGSVCVCVWVERGRKACFGMRLSAWAQEAGRFDFSMRRWMGGWLLQKFMLFSM